MTLAPRPSVSSCTSAAKCSALLSMTRAAQAGLAASRFSKLVAAATTCSPQARCDRYRRKPHAASRSGYEHMLLRLQIGARAQCMQRRGESDQKTCALFERQSFRQLVQHPFWNDGLFCEGAGSLAHDDPIAGTKVLHARAGLNYRFLPIPCPVQKAILA